VRLPDLDASWDHAYRRTVLEIPAEAESTWLAAFGAAAVAVFIHTDSTATTVATQDLARSLRSQRKGDPGAKLASVHWVASLTEALRIANVVGGAGSIVEANELIRHAARELRIALIDHDQVLSRARNAVARLERGLAVAKERGVLMEFNWRFKFLRRQNPKLSYGTAHNRLKAEIARRIAEAGANLPDLGGIVDAVLPLK
jgi:hypothetical protein